MISGLEFGICIGLIILAGVVCAWMMYHLGWLHGNVKGRAEFREELVDTIRRERGELPYDYREAKKRGERG